MKNLVLAPRPADPFERGKCKMHKGYEGKFPS